jgi:hypothetical protein
MFLLQVFVQLAFDALQERSAPESHRKLSPAAWKATRVTLILCAKGMRDQARNLYRARRVFRFLSSKMDREDVAIF